jgi:hypothetical protein
VKKASSNLQILFFKKNESEVENVNRTSPYPRNSAGEMVAGEMVAGEMVTRGTTAGDWYINKCISDSERDLSTKKCTNVGMRVSSYDETGVYR